MQLGKKMDSHYFYDRARDNFLNKEEMTLDPFNKEEILTFCKKLCTDKKEEESRFRKVICQGKELEFDKRRFREREYVVFWRREDCSSKCQRLFKECQNGSENSKKNN